MLITFSHLRHDWRCEPEVYILKVTPGTLSRDLLRDPSGCRERLGSLNPDATSLIKRTGRQNPPKVLDSTPADNSSTYRWPDDTSTVELHGLLPSSEEIHPMAGREVAELRRRNEELERAAREGREREEALRGELERTRERLQAVEEAEERLCVELGELEAEAVAQAREDLLRIETLSHQLSTARALLASAGLRLDLPASN
ncbi:hypothetical protein BHM03_00004141 [Ensete ventricosum]|nr:hypothetical protein BHM03_00004141 [Ensete ventricosum]